MDTSADSVQFEIIKFNDLDEDVICTTKNGQSFSLKEHAFNRFYAPHFNGNFIFNPQAVGRDSEVSCSFYSLCLKFGLEQDLMGFSGVRKPRPTCTRKGVTDICVYQVCSQYCIYI